VQESGNTAAAHIVTVARTVVQNHEETKTCANIEFQSVGPFLFFKL